MAPQAKTTKGIARLQHGPSGRYRAVTPRRVGWTTRAEQVRAVTIANDVSIWPRVAAMALLAAGCREDGSARASAAETSSLGAATAACAVDSLHPATAAPAAGLWVSAQRDGLRVAAMVGHASADADHARITRRVETLEVREHAEAIRLANDTASVTLDLLPPYGDGSRGADQVEKGRPAAVYVVSPLVLLASYEPCAASADEPRIRYLRRDPRGAVATDLMLRRESAETKGLLR